MTAAEKTLQSKAGKDRWSLVPAEFHWVVKVFTFGAAKHADHGWADIPNGQEIYYDALCRHLQEWRSGKEKDDETGLPVLAHAVCDVLILLSLVLRGRGKG